MSKKQATLKQIIDWIADIHKTECSIYRYLHRDDSWRYLTIEGKVVYCGANEYNSSIRCGNCHSSTEICVKRGIIVKDISKEIKCRVCGKSLDIKE